jgi:hypothetical protein
MIENFKRGISLDITDEKHIKSMKENNIKILYIDDDELSFLNFMVEQESFKNEFKNCCFLIKNKFSNKDEILARFLSKCRSYEIIVALDISNCKEIDTEYSLIYNKIITIDNKVNLISNKE